MSVSVLNQAFQYVDDRYLDIVEQEKTMRAKSYKRFMPYWGKAAVACFCLILILIVLPIVAIAANWFGLRDLLIPAVPSGPPAQNEEYGGNAQPIPETGMPNQFIGLSGYQDSPEAQALAEWQTFLATYDSDYAILEEIGNGPSETDDTRYGLYGVYTQDMADKLEEIIQKYGLKLHTDINVVSQEELAFRVGGEFMGEPLKRYWAYIYEDGTFQFDGDIELQGGGMVGFQFTRTVKGTFNETYLKIGDVSDYREFEYVTSGGEMVMCALSPDHALIFMDSESCFILMNVMGGSNCGMTEEDLEDIADSVDFTLLKNVQVPEMRGDSVPSDASEVFEEEKRMLSSINDDLLGCGWLLYTVPDQEDQDYKLYFFADESKDGAERLTPFEEMDFNLDQVDFIFPDARENNRSIGKFIGIYLFEPFTTKSGESAWIVVATYETDGRQYYDTRIYTPSEEGYVIDESMTEELNALYSDVEEYPVLQIIEMPHD